MAFSLVTERGPAVAGQIGSQDKQYAAVSAMPLRDHLDVGSLTVDLRGLDPESISSRTYTASVDTGRLVVLLPADVPITVNYRVGQGVLKTPGQENRSGQPISGTLERAPADASSVLTIDLRVDRGQLEVRR
jgi:hypothetical protein